MWILECVAHVCNLSLWVTEAGGFLRVLDQLVAMWHCEFDGSLSYIVGPFSKVKTIWLLFVHLFLTVYWMCIVCPKEVKYSDGLILELSDHYGYEYHIDIFWNSYCILLTILCIFKIGFFFFHFVVPTSTFLHHFIGLMVLIRMPLIGSYIWMLSH